MDCSFFVLSVDLWEMEGKREQNLVMCPNILSSSLGDRSTHSHPVQYGHDGGCHSSNESQFTRNLIGRLTTSASRLKDETETVGIWFIMQDLSVRTEGKFRLNFSFFNLGLYVLRLSLY